MSKKGRRNNRARRALAATPGAQWTASRAAVRAVEQRDEVLDRYPDNPLLTVLAARHHQIALADLLIYRGHQDRDAHDPRLLAAYQDAYLELTAHPLCTVGPLPENAAAALEQLRAHLPADAVPGDADLRVGHLRNTQSTSTLRVAEVYVVSPAMHAAIMAAADTLTGQDLNSCCEADVLADAGVVYLPYSQPVRPAEGVPRGLRMLTWRLGGRPLPDGRLVRALQIEGWAENPHIAERRLCKRLGHPLPRLLRVCCAWVVLDAAATAEEVGWSTVPSPRLGAIPNHEPDHTATGVVGMFSGDTVDDPHGNLEPRYLYAFMRLAAQQITAMSRPPAMHDNGLPTPNTAMGVRVVRLRSANTEKPDGIEAPAREYRHRHVVRMHKVNQWYPSQQRHKIIWRGPYIRGPEGAPLLVGEKVQALVR